MKNKIKQISKWGLDKHSEKIVRKELKTWLQLFINQANGREGNIYRADFEKADFFYFTDCTDYISKEVEGKAQEMNEFILARKDKVFTQMFIKELLGELKPMKIKCSHCGYDDKFIFAVQNGHAVTCPKCSLTNFNAYPQDFWESAQDVVKMWKKLGIIKDKKEDGE